MNENEGKWIGNYKQWGWIVDLGEEETHFRCPVCEVLQPIPLKTPQGGWTCTACEVPLAGFKPWDTEPSVKPPRPVGGYVLGRLVETCPDSMKGIPYQEWDALDILAEVEEDQQAFWGTLNSLLRVKRVPPTKVVDITLRTLHKKRKGEQTRANEGNTEQPGEISSGHQF